jgi:hypothetical protein
MQKFGYGLFALGFGLASPAFGKAALPSVRLDSAISARTAFGEEVDSRQSSAVNRQSSSQPTTNNSKTIVARSAQRPRADVLDPAKPTNNIWANNKNKNADAPLRMPKREEFVALNNDYQLPEESLAPSHLLSIALAKDEDRGLPVQPVKTASVKQPMIIARQPAYSPQPTTHNLKREIVPMPQAREFAQAPAIERPATPIESRSSNEDFSYKKDDDIPFSKLSPAQLKRAFKKTYVSENKHLSAYDIDSKFDVASDFSSSTSSRAVGFDSVRDLSEKGGVRPLEIKLGFDSGDSSLSRDNYNLLSEYAGIVASNPKRAIQISIAERSVRSYEGRKTAAKRLAIIEQVLRDNGISDARVMPVLADRSDDSFVLRIISNDVYQTLSEQRRDMFGDTISSKSYKSLSW